MSENDLTPSEQDEFRNMLETGAHRIDRSKRQRSQIIAGALAIVLIGSVAGGVAIGALRDPAPIAATPSDYPTKSATSSPTPTPTPTPTATPTSGAAVYTACDQIITDEFQADVANNGWIGWNMIGEEIGHNPFEAIAPGGLEGQLSCRWGAGPDVPTDNVLDLAWAALAGDAVEAAKQTLVAAGFDRIPAEGGEYLAKSGIGSGQAVDEDGYAEAYFFTGSDVRWAATRAHLIYIRQPAG